MIFFISSDGVPLRRTRVCAGRSRSRQATPGFPSAENDPVRVENAVCYYLALKQAKVPAEMHLYPIGGHRYGLRCTAATVTIRPDRAADWMRASG